MSRLPALKTEIVVAAPGWRSLSRPVRPLIRAALAAAREGYLTAPAAVTVLLADDATLRDLNNRFRGKDKPTNVLSFPAGAPAGISPRPLGDLAIAFETTAQEATEAGKPVEDHLCHLVVHGFLHLLGYDHETVAEAELMENAERAILARLGLPDPYLNLDLTTD
jgi:probable rRNA maturation factor